MKATRCDRCKEYFNEEIPMIIYKYNVPADPYEYQMDICKGCLEDFKNFIKAGKVNDK